MFLSPYCCMLNGEAANINFIIFGLIWPWIESTINLLHSRWIFWWLQNQVVTRKNCFRYLKLMSPLNKWYYLKNYYLTLRSKVKVQRKSLWYAIHRLMACTHIPNIIDLSRKTKKLWSGQALLRRSRRSGRKNQTKTICPPSFEGET